MEKRLTDITWQNPPQITSNDRGRPNRYDPVFDTLRANPGRWALIAESQANGTQLSRLRNKAKDLTFQAWKRDDGKVDIYAAFNPLPEDTEIMEDDDQW